MRKELLAAWFALSLLAGCAAGGGDGPPPSGGGNPPEVSSDGMPDYPKDRAVLQVAHGGGLVVPNRVSEAIPDVTIWGDGRVVFAAPDGTVREDQLQPESVDRLIGAASFLYTLEPHYHAAYHTDAPTATFTLLTERGDKTVSVYGLDPVRQQEDEPKPAVFAQLRGLWAKVHEALPADAAELTPTAVCVQTWYSDHESSAEWPPELEGCLTGEAAKRAVTLGGLREAKSFRVGDRVQQVLVVPTLPRPGDWEKPGEEAIKPGHGPDLGPGQPPERLAGRGEDDSLSLEATAQREPDGQYRVATTVTNKADHSIDLLYDCGSLLHVQRLKATPTEKVDYSCPAVHSRMLSAGETVRLETSIALEAVGDGRALSVFVLYETQRNGQPRAIQRLKAELHPAGE